MDRLCKKRIDAIKQVVDVAYHWTSPYSGDPIPESECEFPVHKEFREYKETIKQGMY